MATRGGKCVKLTKLINYIMKKNRNKSLPGGLWLVKNRLMMRMTIVLLLFSSFTAVAQNVTVKMKNSSFIQVAKEIQKQTELTFLYNDAKVGNITGLNPDFTNTDVKAVLEYCLKNSGLTFSIVDNTVVVSPVKSTNQQQENKLTVVGKISDQQGLPLPGVNIIIKGTTLGFVSDVEGKFTAICSRGDSLLFSMVGFEMQIVAINSNSPLNIKMKEATEALDEVVVVSTGYTRLPKERATGSFSVVTAKELEKRPSPNIMNRLEGVVPGVYVDVKNSDMTFLYGSDRTDGYVDEQTNIFTLGALIFEFFGRFSDEEIHQRYCNNQFIPCTLPNWQLSEESYQVATKAVSLNKSERYLTFAEFWYEWKAANSNF